MRFIRVYDPKIAKMGRIYTNRKKDYENFKKKKKIKILLLFVQEKTPQE